MTRKTVGVVIQETTVSSSTESVTIQQPATGTARQISLRKVQVSPATDVMVEIRRDGTAATATSITPGKTDASFDTPTAKAYRASDVGSGTLVDKFPAFGGAESAREFDREVMLPAENTTSKNFTVKVTSPSGGSFSGDVRIRIVWDEF